MKIKEIDFILKILYCTLLMKMKNNIKNEGSKLALFDLIIILLR